MWRAETSLFVSLLTQVKGIGAAQSVCQRRLCLPAPSGLAADVDQFLLHSQRLAHIVPELTIPTNDLLNRAIIIKDAVVMAQPDIHHIGRIFAVYMAIDGVGRSEDNTSELKSLMRNSYPVFCLKKQYN